MTTRIFRPSPGRRPSGIFLIELLIGLAIIAVLVGIALPGFQVLLRSYRVRVVSEDLMSELSWAREEAIRRVAVVTLRTGAQGWDVFIGDAATITPVPAAILRTYRLPAAISVAAKYENSSFDAGGNASPRSNRLVVGWDGAPANDPSTRLLCIGFGGRVRLAFGTTC